MKQFLLAILLAIGLGNQSWAEDNIPETEGSTSETEGNASEAQANASETQEDTSEAQGEKRTLELPDYPRFVVETNLGTFTIELYTSRAPLTVTNFVSNAVNGFYEGTVFHRVMGGFVVQAGGYDANYQLKETTKMVPNESGNGLSNRRGSLAMARTADPHSANSQFYINLADNLPLDPRPSRWGYTVFGRVTEGMEVIDEIGYVATGPGPVPELTKDVPKEPINITRVTLLEEAPTNEQPAAE
jgi:peptidyl-prolyl cis-trans isomerase A (cyclophilin A)